MSVDRCLVLFLVGGFSRLHSLERMSSILFYPITQTTSAHWAASVTPRAVLRFSATLSMNSKVLSHRERSGVLVPCTQMAKSLVMAPDSTVSMITLSRVSQKLFSSALSSSLARWRRPRVQANIEAIELVEVSPPFWWTR